jgi:hypothetical protein
LTLSLRAFLALAVGVVLALGLVGHVALDVDRVTPSGPMSDAGVPTPYVVAGIVACVAPAGSTSDARTCDEVPPRYSRHRGVWMTEC